MPTTAIDYEDIKKEQEKARKLIGEAGKLSSGAKTFGANVWEKIRNARSQRGIDQLAKGVGRTSEQLASQGQEVRGRLRGEVNPMDVIDVTKSDRARALGTLSTLATAREQRSGALSDVIGAGTNRLKAAAAAKQAEAKQASQEAQDMIDLVKLKEQREAQDFKEWYKRQQLGLQRQKLQQQGPGGKVQLGNLKADIQSGYTLDDVMKKYSDTLSSGNILRMYNINSPYGPAKETPATLEQRYGVEPSKTALQRQEATGVLESLKGMKDVTGGVKGTMLYRNKREATARFLGKMVEQNRLSNQDFESYKRLLPSIWQVTFAPGLAEGKIDQAVTFIENKLGIEGGGSVRGTTGSAGGGISSFADQYSE